MWALGGCIPYASWKRAVREIRNHDVRKIPVKPTEYIVSKGFYKEKYVLIEIDGDPFAEYFPVKDDVYDNRDTIELWAYYLEYTTKEQRKNRNLKKYGIFLVGVIKQQSGA